jgi:cytidylate kinase
MAIITVSRGTMSGGQALAECVASALGVPCVGRELVVEAAAALGVSGDVLREKMEKSPSLWARMTRQRTTYVAAVRAALAEHATTGNLVYHGFAGQLLLRGLPGVVRVRVIAPMEQRLRTVMDRQQMTRQAAERYVEAVDADRERWVRLVYGEDIRDPGLYDVVLNLDVISLEGACACVVGLAQRPEFGITPAVLARLDDFAVGCRVEVALLAAPATRALDLRVSVLGGVVTVRGEVPDAAMVTDLSKRWEDDVRPVVEAVRGVKGVDLRLRAVYPHA